MHNDTISFQVKQYDKTLIEKIKENWQQIKQPLHSLGQMENMVAEFGAMLGTVNPPELKPAMVLMCGDHGIAKYGVSAYPPEVTIQMIHNYMNGTAGANIMARHADTDLFVVDVGVNADLSYLPNVRNEKVAYGTNDFTQGPAMTKQQALKAIEAGIKVANEYIDKGYNLLVTAEMGIGNTTSTAAIASAFLELDPELTVGRGTGINDDRMKIKRRIVTEGLAINKPVAHDAMDILTKVGGYDHAGLAGVIIGGAKRGIPTMIDGVNATAAALIAWGLCPSVADYMLCSHLSEEIAHVKMLKLLGLAPVVDAGMRLGEGTGASLAIVILNAAIKTYQELENHA
ncbi:MAG TPA: nicotinate-nucleotide--dimethylbenzimidazole phosphoribosyltransferase [Candidatus Avacidaminococcus intestinavium]|uniref:Nicotinate-nucleotide--dimethylbenzimidazole phosphoribosyltransferase n=1 Tax=Candidatus Avacidaminococcus intestinavium TaxID=2840684 RepID=A0A9D1MQY3_9FIRM|nr:nicotinate-nucleotide--dimethylbenzimidazole phosphoribosyltransferase [Candidatus Avacidaminococcus intestinavium]